MTNTSAARVATMVALALMTGASLTPATAQDINAVIDKAVQKYATVRTARGNLKQTNRTPLGSTYNLTADFQQQFPGLLSVRYSDPKGDIIVVNGKFHWIFLPSSNPGEVQKIPVSQSGGTVNLIGVFLDSPRTKYILSDSGRQTIDGHVTRAIGLVPRQPMEEFRRATVWIEEETGVIRQFEIAQTSGMVSKFNFVTLQLNVPVDSSQFRFSAPRGVKVVERGG